MKRLLFLLCLIHSAFLQAQTSVSNDAYYKVVRLYSWESGWVHLWLESGGEHICEDQTYPRRYLMKRGDTLEFDQKFSLLLAARMSGEGVKLTYHCVGDSPIIGSIRL